MAMKAKACLPSRHAQMADSTSKRCLTGKTMENVRKRTKDALDDHLDELVIFFIITNIKMLLLVTNSHLEDQLRNNYIVE